MFSVTCGEEGVTVTVIGCINVLESSAPPVLIFRLVHFEDHMLISASTGMHETFYLNGWLYGLKFLEFLDGFIYHMKPVGRCFYS